MDNTWILVANASQATVYNQKNNKELEDVESFTHEESRLKKSEFTSDRPGRVNDQFAPKGANLKPARDPHNQTLEDFAKEISTFLEHARKGGEFKNLIITSSPKFLGALNKKISAQTKKNIVKYIAKDFSHYSKNQIQERLVS